MTRVIIPAGPTAAAPLVVAIDATKSVTVTNVSDTAAVGRAITAGGAQEWVRIPPNTDTILTAAGVNIIQVDLYNYNSPRAGSGATAWISPVTVLITASAGVDNSSPALKYFGRGTNAQNVTGISVAQLNALDRNPGSAMTVSGSHWEASADGVASVTLSAEIELTTFSEPALAVKLEPQLNSATIVPDVSQALLSLGERKLFMVKRVVDVVAGDRIRGRFHASGVGNTITARSYVMEVDFQES